MSHLKARAILNAIAAAKVRADLSSSDMSLILLLPLFSLMLLLFFG